MTEEELEQQRMMAKALIKIFVPDRWIPFVGNLRLKAEMLIMDRIKRDLLRLNSYTDNSITIYWNIKK